MHRAMRTVGFVASLAVCCSGCVSTKRFAELQEEVRSVDADDRAIDEDVAKANRRIDDLKSLTADVKAVRGYFLEVKESVRQMRDETILLLDEYRVGIEETRAGYVRALRGQQDSIQVVIDELEKNVSAGGESIAKEPVGPALGTSSK